MPLTKTKLEDLREERFKLATQAREILKKEGLTKEDETKFDAIMADVDKLAVQIAREEKLIGVEQGLNQIVDIRAATEDRSPDEIKEEQAKVKRAYNNLLRHGIQGLREDERALMSRRFVTDPRMEGAHIPRPQAAQGVGTGAGGGFTVPDEDMRAIVEALKAFGGMRQVSTIIPTSTGADLPIPTDNDTAVMGEIIAENVVHNEGDITFAQVVLQSFLYSSKIIRVSRQFLQDSSIDVAGFINRKFGQRLGRIQNLHFTTGDGSSKPRGAVTASTLGKTAASATAITYSELVDLMHSVDPEYAMNGRFMFNWVTLGAVRKLLDTTNMPIWAPMAGGAPDTILGRPFAVNQDMPPMTTGQKSVLFGDFSNYHIRDVGNVIVLRLEERYADFLQVGFLGFLRSDGDLVDAGTNPIKHLIQA